MPKQQHKKVKLYTCRPDQTVKGVEVQGKYPVKCSAKMLLG